MANIDSFSSNSKFYGDKYFPYGISRSGEFSSHQVQLLEHHGYAYEALHTGSRKPATPAEEDFVAVCQGKREPSTEHEKAWAALLKKTQRNPAVSAFGSIPLEQPETAVEDPELFDEELGSAE